MHSSEWSEEPATAALEIDGLRVVADATFYYLDDLRRSLASGTRVSGPGLPLDRPEGVIALAYRRWGADLARHLEGDFAFALWDANEGILVAARDFAGARPLFWAGNDSSLTLSSSARSLRALDPAAHAVDPAILAAAAAGFSFATGPDTAFRGVRVLEAGTTLVWRPGSGPALRTHWTPPEWRTPQRSFEDAALELRSLLFDAVQTRLAGRRGPTAITLSGGWDSTAVFAAARALIEDGRVDADTVQISIRYPPEDPGHEDALIQSALDRWNRETRWLDSEGLRLFQDPAGDAERRDGPMGHLFEHWNRGLAHAAARAGAGVMFTGYGGDQLFQVSDVYLADLLRRGRWLRLWREWRLKGGTGVRPFLQYAVIPNLADGLAGMLRALGGPPRYLARPLPQWMRSDFARSHGLKARERVHLAPRGMARAEAEWVWYLRNPFYPAVTSWVAGFGADAGVEVRTPLYDRRIIDFQAGRPWADRSWGAETKLLLRQAMVGLLPPSLLAPRPRRTGITSSYARSQMGHTLPPVVRRLHGDGFRLADLGIIDPDRYRDAALAAFEGRAPQDELTAWMTLSAELWIRRLEQADAVPRHRREASAIEAAHG